MPNIKQYGAPALSIDPTETGIRATAEAGRRAGASFNEVAQAAEAVGGTFARNLGSAVKAAGDQVVAYAEHREISHGAAAFANVFSDLTQQWNDVVKSPKTDPNDPTVAQRFREQTLEPQLEKIRDGFLTEGGQRWAESQVEHLRNHMFQKTAADMSSMAGDAAVVNSRQTVNALSNAVLSDPSALRAALSTLENSTGALVASAPNLTPSAAAEVRTKLLQQGKESVVKSAAIGAIEKTGKIPAWVSDPEFAPYVNGTELKQFEGVARYYQRLSASEARDVRVQQDYQAKKDFNSKVNELEAATMPQNVGDTPQLPADYWQKLRDLAKHPGAALEPGRLKTMVTNGEAITTRLGKPEPLSHVSHETSIDILQRMRASDDTRLSDNSAIYKAYEDGKLNNTDFSFLMREFNNMRTPEGERLMERKAAFIKSVTPAISHANPLLGNMDPDGSANLYKLEWDINRKIDEYRKAGRDPYDLFDPSKPDFMGKPEALAPYQKSLSQSLQDQAARLRGNLTGPGKTITGVEVTAVPPPPARKAGESPAEYLKRIGKQ